MNRTALVLAGIVSLVSSAIVQGDDISSELASKRPLTQGSLNYRPIIGVLTQPIDDGMKQKNPQLANYSSYIMASYINALGAAGARTVPLIFNNPNTTEELEKIDKINGVFYCGGDAVGDYWTFG